MESKYPPGGSELQGREPYTVKELQSKFKSTLRVAAQVMRIAFFAILCIACVADDFDNPGSKSTTRSVRPAAATDGDSDEAGGHAGPGLCEPILAPDAFDRPAEAAVSEISLSTTPRPRSLSVRQMRGRAPPTLL